MYIYISISKHIKDGANGIPFNRNDNNRHIGLIPNLRDKNSLKYDIIIGFKNWFIRLRKFLFIPCLLNFIMKAC